MKPSDVVSIHPCFRVKPGRLAEVRAALPRFVAATARESGNL